jgi:hypothetical protein
MKLQVLVTIHVRRIQLPPKAAALQGQGMVVVYPGQGSWV